MNTNLIINEDDIEDLIYEIRGKQIMIDSDLAKIYGYTTKDFNRQVKNNIERFDDDFRFQLTKDEYYDILRCKNFTLELKQGQYTKYLPYAFTEQGIYMLMTVLKGEKAIKQSKTLIRLFKSMKNYIIDNDLTKDYISYVQNINLIEGKLLEHDEDIKLLKETFNKFEDKKTKNKILYKGQYYDSYSFLLDILNSAKEEIIIIDNYTDKKILDLVCKTKNKVLIVSKNMDNELIKKYCKQYNNLTIKQSEEFHDRFIIIDKEVLYHLGASLKDLGKGCFGINMIDNKNLLNSLLNEIIS